jgi:hypothetical protein
MSIINKGTTFSNGEQLTAEGLNDMLDLATFNQSATDGTSTSVNSGGQIVVVDAGITSQKLAIDSVTTSSIVNNNVTFEKLTDVIDDDTMATATSANLATSESIRAYVNNSITANYNLVYSGATGTLTVPLANSTSTWDMSSIVGFQRAVVYVQVTGIVNGLNNDVFFRTVGETYFPDTGNEGGPGITYASVRYSNPRSYGGVVALLTDENGQVEYGRVINKGINDIPQDIAYKVITYQRISG